MSTLLKCRSQKTLGLQLLVGLMLIARATSRIILIGDNLHRDGNQACATILYSKSDISQCHANPWIMNNLHDRDRCNRILSSFSVSWRYIHADLTEVYRRRLLLDMFGETNTPTSATGDCCDVCSQNWADKRDFKVELGIVIDTIKHIGFKGEVKRAE